LYQKGLNASTGGVGFNFIEDGKQQRSVFDIITAMCANQSTSHPSLHRQRTYQVEAIVLRHSDWGEADRLLWLYTLEMGKIRAVAKGVRKPLSRKAGHLEPFMRVQMLLARGRDLPLVTQVDTLDAYLPLREDLAGATYASYVIELLDRFTYEEGENRLLYRLLNDTLARLCQHPEQELVLRYYEVRLLDLVGFRPQLFHCVICQAEILPEDQYFSAQVGGAVCPRCGAQTDGAQPISMAALKHLRHFQRSNFSEASRARLSPSLNREIEVIIQHYLTYLLERGLNTPAFLRRVRKMAIDHDDLEE
jgi:DNA repair protein RecO (recombination protein O)